jgi:hypothetical protein
MKEAYTLVKTEKRLTIKVYPAGFSLFQSSNIDYFFQLSPFLIAYVSFLAFSSWESIKLVYGFILIGDVSFSRLQNFENLYNIFILICFYIPAWMFVKSINTYEAIYFTRETITIEKQVLRFKKMSKSIPVKLVKQATLGLQVQLAARGSQEFRTALTSCTIVDCYRKEHRFGFWLSLYDQGIIVSEMSSFLNTLRAK